jgi:hypothetical protein
MLQEPAANKDSGFLHAELALTWRRAATSSTGARSSSFTPTPTRGMLIGSLFATGCGRLHAKGPIHCAAWRRVSGVARG